MAKAGWHTTKSEFVDTPLLDELPMAMERQLVSYDPEGCRLVGKVAEVSADESVRGRERARQTSFGRLYLSPSTLSAAC